MGTPVPAVRTSTNAVWVPNKYKATTCCIREQNDQITTIVNKSSENFHVKNILTQSGEFTSDPSQFFH